MVVGMTGRQAPAQGAFTQNKGSRPLETEAETVRTTRFNSAFGVRPAKRTRKSGCRPPWKAGQESG